VCFLIEFNNFNSMVKIDPQKEWLYSEIKKRGNETKNEFNKIISQNAEEPILINMIKELQYFSDDYRTALTSISCEAVGGDPMDTVLISTLVNLVSAGFAIHDDIMDNSLYKRFSPTLFGKYGRDYSLTFGDYLVIKTLPLTSQMIDFYSKEIILQILDELGRLYTTLIEGELMEINLRRNLDVELEYYHSMMWKITNDGEACAKLGGIVGKGIKTQVSSLAEVGKRLGYLWRLYEEILDTLNLNAKLVSRINHECIPLPLLFAAKRSNSSYDLIKPIIQKTDLSKSDIEILINECFEADAFNYIRGLSKEKFGEAVEKISVLEESDEKQLLVLFLEDILEKIEEICV